MIYTKYFIQFFLNLVIVITTYNIIQYFYIFVYLYLVIKNIQKFIKKNIHKLERQYIKLLHIILYGCSWPSGWEVGNPQFWAGFEPPKQQFLWNN